MAKDLWSVLREQDPLASPKSVDATSIARNLAALPPKQADAWLASFQKAAAKPPTPAASLVDFESVEARLRMILSHRDQQDQRQRANDAIDEVLVEWAVRKQFEAWSGLRVGRYDTKDHDWEMNVARLKARLERLGEGSEDAIAFTAARLAVWNAVLSASSGSDFPRSTKVSNLKGPKAELRFQNPCRPLKVGVTKYPQRDVYPDHPSDSWKNPIRLIDAHLGTKSGKPPILLIHGHGSLAEECEGLIDELRKIKATRDVRILVPDLPGYGYSDASALGELSTAIYLRLLQQLMTQLGVQKFVPAGGSLGGNLTMQLLATGDARIPTGIAWSVVSWRAPDAEMQWMAKWARVGRELGPAFFWAVYNHQKYQWFPNWKKKLAERALKDSDIYRREVFSNEYLRATWDLIIDQCEHFHLAKVPKIKVPVRLLGGKHDQALGVYPSMVELGKMLRKQLGEDRCDFFDDFEFGDHSLASEEPGLVAEKVAEWYGRFGGK